MPNRTVRQIATRAFTGTHSEAVTLAVFGLLLVGYSVVNGFVYFDYVRHETLGAAATGGVFAGIAMAGLVLLAAAAALFASRVLGEAIL